MNTHFNSKKFKVDLWDLLDLFRAGAKLIFSQYSMPVSDHFLNKSEANL